MPRPNSTSIVELLRAGNASEAVISQLTPAARNLTRGDLVALWLADDQETQGSLGVHGTGNLHRPQLQSEDVTSILSAFDNTAHAGHGQNPNPHGFFCPWECCCCTPCCCCVVAVVSPLKEIV
jgi:hypothetical protein